MLRDNGMPNAIDKIIEGTSAEGMSTTDFLYWFGDFASGEVQYSHTSRICAGIKPFLPFSNEKRFLPCVNLRLKAVTLLPITMCVKTTTSSAPQLT
jgi:hypothetical protein